MLNQQGEKYNFCQCVLWTSHSFTTGHLKRELSEQHIEINQNEGLSPSLVFVLLYKKHTWLCGFEGGSLP